MEPVTSQFLGREVGGFHRTPFAVAVSMTAGPRLQAAVLNTIAGMLMASLLPREVFWQLSEKAEEALMAHCVCCGSDVPEGQRTCSMCYGDIDHGKDGYYREWAERQERERDESDES